MGVEISACGVVCSQCGAFVAAKKADPALQVRVADTWNKIYKLEVKPESVSCGGCLNVDAVPFATCKDCFVRECVLSKGIAHCGLCDQYPCAELERVQAQFDGLEKLAATMSEDDFAEMVEPYCQSRERISAAVRRPWDWA
jgi:hypothetical protein